MNLFEKVEYRTVELPFYYIEEDDVYKAHSISIEAYGSIDGVKTYFYFIFNLTESYMYDNGDYEDMIRVLKRINKGRLVIKLKYKKNKLVNFKLDDTTLVYNTGDQRFDYIDIFFWSFGKKSMRQEGLRDYE